MAKFLKKISFSVFIGLLAIAGHAFPAYSQSDSSGAAKKRHVIVIDAGHGGRDFGAQGIRTRAKEKDITLQVALKLGKKIGRELPEVKVVYTRETDDFVPLYARPEVANHYKADLFVSIHCNSGGVRRIRKKNSKGRYYTTRVPNTTAFGTETFVSGLKRLREQDEAVRESVMREDEVVIEEDVAARENASILLEENYTKNYGGFDPNDPSSAIILHLMKNKYREESVKLAKLIQQNYEAAGRGNRGVQELSLAVLARTGMPAVLTEIGFLSNPEEEKLLISEAGQNQIVANLFEAIKTYLYKTTGQ